jgi:hypothetical protein
MYGSNPGDDGGDESTRVPGEDGGDDGGGGDTFLYMGERKKAGLITACGMYSGKRLVIAPV